MNSQSYYKMLLKEYYNLLDKHDWFYEYSDDFSVWSAGQNKRQKLLAIAKESDTHKQLYIAFEQYKFNQAPKPKEPDN